MMNTKAHGQTIIKAWKAAARKWQIDMQEQTEKGVAVVTEAIEESHVQSLSHMLNQVEKARIDLQLTQRQVRQQELKAFQKKLEHKSRMKLIEQERLQAHIRDDANRIEIETLKAHILTMWNRMGVSAEDRERWLLKIEDEIKGDINFNDATPDKRQDFQAVLTSLYSTSIKRFKKLQSNNGGNVEDRPNFMPEPKWDEKNWRRRSLYGVRKIPLRTPLPNDERRQYNSLHGGDVGMAPSAEID